MAGKKLIYGVGISDDGEFARTYRGNVRTHVTKEYGLWIDMLKRCYSEKFHLKRPTYKGTSISENFKSFQYFAKWCQCQIGFKLMGYQLDKDILATRSKIYCEDICVFLPRGVNTFLTSAGAARGKFPIGVTLVNCEQYLSRVSNGNGRTRTLGIYKTPELAFAAYKTAKEVMAKELAIQYEGLVDPRVTVALSNYVVDIRD